MDFIGALATIGALAAVAGVILLVAVFAVVLEAVWGTVVDWRRYRRGNG